MRISKQSVGAWVMLGGFLTALALLNWVGVIVGYGVLAGTLVLDLFLVRNEEHTISEWIWHRFDRIQGWIFLIIVVLSVAARVGFKETMEPGLLPGFLAGLLSLYLVIAGHAYWDERDEDKEPK